MYYTTLALKKLICRDTKPINSSDKIALSAVIARNNDTVASTRKSVIRRLFKALPVGIGILGFCASTALAFQVYGAIAVKWQQLGAQYGPLGPAMSDEGPAARGGRFNTFKSGYIYWHPAFGAHAVYGDIGIKWNALGRENAVGYPLTDERSGAHGTRYNDFENGGTIVWSPHRGSFLVYGAIRAEWVKRGREAGNCGSPISDEFSYGSYRRSNFEKGFILWSRNTGVKAYCAMTIDNGTALNPI